MPEPEKIDQDKVGAEKSSDPESAPVTQDTEEIAAEKPTAPEPEEEQPRMGRVVLNGVISLAILCALVLLTMGLFSAGGAFKAKQPADIRVSDPSPVLWSAITSETAAPAPLGVPENDPMVRLKGEAKESTSTTDSK